MYNGYPYTVVVIYYEAPSVEVSIKQIKKIAKMIRESNNYLISRHTNIYLITNVFSDAKEKEFHVLASKDNCVAKIICANGYKTEEIINIALGQQLDEIKSITEKSLEKIKLLPVHVLAIQYKGTANRVNINMFPEYKKYMQLYTFAIDHASANMFGNEGDFGQLQMYIHNLFEVKLTKIIADNISKKKEVLVEAQSFFQLL